MKLLRKSTELGGWTRRAERTSRWQQSRRYWVWRQRRDRLAFKFYARALNSRRSLRERRAAVAAAGSIFTGVLSAFLLALVVAGALELLDRLVLQRAGVLRTISPDHFADRAARRFRAGVQADGLSLFGTIAQIAGVFLGLYFTAVSGIAATVYADVPGEVRLLLTREKLGNVYIKIVAFLGAFALVLSTAKVIGIEIGLVNTAVVGVLGALSIFAFVMLGLRTFYFFSPDTLTGYVVKDVRPLFQAARRRRLGSKHRAIPFNYQRQAEELLSTLRSVVRLSAARTSVTERSLLSIVVNNLSLLYLYESLKGDIETSSLWFKQRLEFPSWLSADRSMVQMAVHTQTGIQAKQVGDRQWVERELLDVLRLAIGALLDRPDRARAVEAFEHLVVRARNLGSQLAVDETLMLAELASALAEEHLVARPEGDRTVESIAIADLSSSLLMQIVLGMSDRLRPMTGESFASETADLDPIASLESAWPLEVINQREYVGERLARERIVEGRRISADWYVSQLLALSMSRFFARIIPTLVAELEKLPASVQSRLDAQQPIIAAAILQRGIETCQKFSFHLGEFSACIERIAALRRAMDVPWAETDWADAQRRVTEVRTQLLVLTAKIAIEVSTIDTGGEIPDYFGASYRFLAEECFQNILADEDETFARLFPAFFSASLTAHERLNRELATQNDRTRLIFSTEPIDDLLEISGYALLKNELGHGGCWVSTKELWDKYLEGQDRTEFFTFLFAVISYRGGVFGIKPGDIGRTTWQQMFRQHLVDQGMLRSRSYGPYDVDDEELDVDSPLLRAATEGMFGHDASQAFVVGYLLTWSESQGLDLPRETEVFLESLEFARRHEADDEPMDFDDQTARPEVPTDENASEPQEDGGDDADA
jgi:hypothetical protein